MRNKKGFTLIEMLIVVVIIGILGAVIVPSMSGSSDKARKAACKANVRNIQSTIELMTFEHNVAANSVDWSAFPSGNITTAGGATTGGTGFTLANWQNYFPDGGVACPVTEVEYIIYNGKVSGATDGSATHDSLH